MNEIVDDSMIVGPYLLSWKGYCCDRGLNVHQSMYSMRISIKPINHSTPHPQVYRSDFACIEKQILMGALLLESAHSPLEIAQSVQRRLSFSFSVPCSLLWTPGRYVYPLTASTWQSVE